MTEYICTHPDDKDSWCHYCCKDCSDRWGCMSPCRIYIQNFKAECEYRKAKESEEEGMSRMGVYDDKHGFVPFDDANTSNELNALDCVEERKKGEWEMFDLISSAYYGKGMYFKQDNEIVYSRHSNKYMTVDEAIKEFISLINEGNIAFVPSVTTTWADEEAPTYVLQKRGKWEKHNDGIMFWWECSECHQDPWYDREELYDYCPSCGAKMKFGESEKEKDEHIN